MKHYIFGQPKQLKQLAVPLKTISETLNRVAENTDVSGLVTTLYLLPGAHQARGVYLRQWASAAKFHTGRGNWAFTRHFPVPNDLPETFRLIRMRLDGSPRGFPREELDAYGWHFHYQHFEDQLALLFAHELHHFRRYHLNMHAREGEHGANRWALSRVQALGFHVSAQKIQAKKKKTSRPLFLLNRHDPFQSFRRLKPGDLLIVNKDPRQIYTHQTVRVVRPIRSNSKRIVIETADEKQWRWPMNWLTPAEK